ncbi:MAG: lytic murein transglycosylase [Pseudobdellovibrionaceae bacterium]
MLGFLLKFIIFFSFTCPLFASPKTHSAKEHPLTKTSIKANIKWLRKELNKIGFSQGFITESLQYYEPKSFEKVLTLNLLGFMQPPGQHMNLVTPQSVRESISFIKENEDYFALAKENYQVPASVISALLWIETRHGDDVGNFHIVSVYLHLLQADLPPNRKKLTLLAIEKNKKDLEYEESEIKTIMRERTKKRNLWAREQLIALASIRKKKHLNLKTLRGSYAGALGLPQFIPSSYLEFAKAAKAKSTPDLNSSGDAIMSVAYYLSKHGWQNCDAEAKVAALMKYNNSRDYAESILEISKRASARNQAENQQANTSGKSRSLSSTEDLDPSSLCKEESP